LGSDGTADWPSDHRDSSPDWRRQVPTTSDLVRVKLPGFAELADGCERYSPVDIRRLRSGLHQVAVPYDLSGRDGVQRKDRDLGRPSPTYLMSVTDTLAVI
jgi:hypothetical protein